MRFVYMRYTVPMSRRACCMLYTCQQITLLPSVIVGSVFCVRAANCVNTLPCSCMLCACYIASLCRCSQSLADRGNAVIDGVHMFFVCQQCWAPAGCSASSCCCLVTLCYCEHYIVTQSETMLCICSSAAEHGRQTLKLCTLKTSCFLLHYAQLTWRITTSRLDMHICWSRSG